MMTKKVDISHLDKDNMLIVHCVTENEDGSANVELDIGGDALRLLIELGFRTLLTLAIEAGVNNSDDKQGEEK